MTKMYCDFCGKEIEGGPIVREFGHRSPRGKYPPMIFYEYDLCQECAHKSDELTEQIMDLQTTFWETNVHKIGRPCKI